MKPRTYFSVLLGLGCSFASEPAHGAPTNELPLISSAQSIQDPLARLANEVMKLPVDEPSLVVVGSVSSKNSTGGDSLRIEVRDSILEHIASAVPLYRKRDPRALTPLEARALARKRDLPLVYITPSVRGSTLQLSIRYLRWPRSFWQRTLKPEGAVGHSSVHRIDATRLLRRFAAPAPKIFSSIKKYPSPVTRPIAVGCSISQGRFTVVLVGRREIRLGHLEKNTFLSKFIRDWASLSPIAPSPLRSPLASVVLDDKRILVGSSDRTHLLELNHQLKVTRRVPRAYPHNDGTCSWFTSEGISEETGQCGTPSRKRLTALDAFSVAHIPDKEGTYARATFRLPLDDEGTVSYRGAAGQKFSSAVIGVGDQVAWGDLDGEGQVEVLSSSDKLHSDELRVHRFKAGKLTDVTRIPTPRIHGIAICPFAGKNPRATIAAVGKELWVLK